MLGTTPRRAETHRSSGEAERLLSIADEPAQMAISRGYSQMTVFAERKGSITVSALLGTGLVTLGVAVTGLAGLGDDLRAANLQVKPVPTTPLLTPEDEVQGPAISDSQLEGLHVDCDDDRTSRSEATGGDGSSRET